MTQTPLRRKEESRHQLAAQVFAIIQESQLTRDEIQVLFGGGTQGTAGKNVDSAAERIISLFISEKLTIEEGKEVLKEVTDSLPRDTDTALP